MITSIAETCPKKSFKASSEESTEATFNGITGLTIDQMLNEDIDTSKDHSSDCTKVEEAFKAFKDSEGIERRGEVQEESLKLIMELQKEEEAERKKTKRMEEESIILIKKMQLEEEKELKARVKDKEEQDATSCEICLDIIDIKDLLPLDYCGHLYHSKCLARYFMTEIDARRFPLCSLCCPTCRDKVSVLDIKEILSEDALKKWEVYT
jgi:hypothetical protein